MTEGCSLYEEDFVRWSEEQADAIRMAAGSGTNLPLDWENIAEEIGSLGKSLRSELRSRLGTVIEHLLKLALSDAEGPRQGWIETVGRERAELDDLLDDNPSLRATLVETVEQAHRKGRKLAALSLERHGELSDELLDALGGVRFDPDQLLGQWVPTRRTPFPGG